MQNRQTEQNQDFRLDFACPKAYKGTSSGEVLFDILSKYDLREVYISDINAELINTYCIIRNDVDALIKILYTMQSEFVPLDTGSRKIYYNEKRERFNDLKVKGNESVNIEGDLYKHLLGKPGADLFAFVGV